MNSLALSRRLTGWTVAESLLKTLVLFFVLATLFVASVNATSRLPIDMQADLLTALAYNS